MPLSSSSRWEYEVEISKPGTPVQKATTVIRIDGTVEIDKQTYYKEITITPGIPGAPNQTLFRRITPTGVYTRLSTDPTGPEALLLALPPLVGKE